MVNKPKLYIITPVFNEEAGLDFYVQQVKNLLMQRDDFTAHVIFVDDGSTDKSWEKIERICTEDSAFLGLRLSRNFGSHVAISAGIEAVEDADALCTLACDLQDPPEVILDFMQQWKAGTHIVWGKRRTRQDSPWKIKASNLFSRLLARFAMPKGSLFCTGSFLLMDKLVIEAFKQFHERRRITFALVGWMGFTQAVVEYDRKERTTGASGWNITKMFSAMYDAFIGYSSLPIDVMKNVGRTFFVLDFLFSFYLILSWIFWTPLPGWTSLMVVMLFCFGLLFFMLGIMGEYLARIYAEVSGRPLYFIQQKVNL